MIALTKALIRAGMWLDENANANRPEAVDILARKEYVGADKAVLTNSMTGTFAYEKGDVRPAPDFNIFFRYNATFPYYSDAVWTMTQMRRWGQIAEAQPDAWYDAVAKSVYKPAIYVEAARELIAEGKAQASDFDFDADGYKDPTADFIDRIRYDGMHPNAYIDSLAIGLKGNVIHLMGHLMERKLDPSAGYLLQKDLERRGITVHCKGATKAILGHDKVDAVLLEDGTVYPADLVCMAVGIRPEVRLANDAHLDVGRGITVNDQMTTSDPAIHALGECIEHDRQLFGLVAPLYDQAKVLAATLAGQVSAFRPVQTATRLKVTGVDLFSAGDFADAPGREDIIFRDPGRGIYKRLVIAGDKLLGRRQSADVQMRRPYARGCAALDQGGRAEVDPGGDAGTGLAQRWRLCVLPTCAELLPDFRLAAGLQRRPPKPLCERTQPRHIQKDGTCSVVPCMWGGVTTPAELRAIADAADRYAVPMLKVTGGQRIGLLGARKADLPSIWAETVVTVFSQGINQSATGTDKVPVLSDTLYRRSSFSCRWCQTRPFWAIVG